MKVNEVPQDKSFLEEGKVRDVCYATDENGDYKKVLSVGWEPKNEAIKLAWEDIAENAHDIAKEVLDGKKSPLAYYLEIKAMTVKILSDYTGISRFRVKKHLKPEKFNKLSDSVLKKYAEALHLSVDELCSIDMIKKEIEDNEDRLPA
ncbi:MAG: hypothetical protein C0594_06065 [Marinilabiliales bacterium]|nr:MAG: hypothetical protein C0594_06065 [Marinilabiliales bacterium]